MSAAVQPGRAAPRGVRRTLTRRWNITVRRVREAQVSWVVVLVAVSVLIGTAVASERFMIEVAWLAVPMMLASLVLGPQMLPWCVSLILGVLIVVLALRDEPLEIAGQSFAVLVIGMIILVSSFRRVRLGVTGPRGESMLVDLRDRLRRQGRLPDLPQNWYAESVMRSAGASKFAGDFIVATRSVCGRSFEVVVVDVSGKGEQAGTRALLLSGAFGGLLGTLPAAEFLPAANRYLLRQEWEEGFATAIHLSVDLQTGAFELRSAGHPPGVQLHAGSGRWALHATEGPVLGVVADAEFTVARGTVNPGDALLLYTDGLVETPQRDMTLGIDKLLGEGERLLRSGFERGARKLIDRLESENDDRALVMLHRR